MTGCVSAEAGADAGSSACVCAGAGFGAISLPRDLRGALPLRPQVSSSPDMKPAIMPGYTFFPRGCVDGSDGAPAMI